ncbi:MAG: amidase family protein, partial [Chloroflexota bacterium]|nr:amidase family protein [Chloroflexota bacterium]
GMAAFFARYMPEGPVRSLQDVVDWNNANADVALAMNGQGGLTEALVELSLDDPEYRDIASNLVTQARGNGMDVVMDEHNLDAILAPTAPVPTTLESNSFPGSSTQMSALSGYPSITVPVGWSEHGLPVGMHLSGRAFGEQTLLRIAYATEQLINARVAPVV